MSEVTAALPHDTTNTCAITAKWIVQFQINDPNYQYAGEWFDKFEKDTAEEGYAMLMKARTRYADSADAYRLVMVQKMVAESRTVFSY